MRERERESIYSPQWQSARKGQCLLMLGTKQTKIMPKYKCNKNLPNLVSTVINNHTVISRYLFTNADKMNRI